MYREVKVGETLVPMLANAATAIRYKQVFGKNILAYFMGTAKNEDIAEAVQELAYIMAKAADKADMNKLNIDDYIEWTSQFNGFDLLKASDQILALYQGNEVSKSSSKKKHDRPNAK